MGWAIGHKVTIVDGIEEELDIDVQVGDIVGIQLDYVNEKISFRVNDGDWIEGLDFPTLSSGTYYLAFGNYDNQLATNIKVHFTDDLLEYSAPVGYQEGWGTPQTRRRRKYTHNSYYCTGVNRYQRMWDGNDGLFGVIFEVNSSTCGYVPPPPEGTVLSYYCQGVDRWVRIADGVGGFTTELFEVRSVTCGYKPLGTLLGTYCEGYDKWGTYSDGEFGSYTRLMQLNSRECGYNDGSGSTGPGGPILDPNLEVTDVEGLVFDEMLFGMDASLVFRKPIDQETDLDTDGFIKPIQVGYDDD
jgi:hypothetical protein